MHRILVVEDSAPQREMIVSLLKDKGMTVMAASNGSEALECVKQAVPHLVITDVVMPVMNGYELIRQLRKPEAATVNVPILVCSSKGEPFDEHWAKRQGATDYIVKPFEPQQLLAKVMALLQAQ
ncbi:MAG: response regulator [Gloeomargarita sp. SKYBB_i_bin120]|nr:response regulator [Gloeomargarita sp. SKYG98]MCS7292425.1 response regulator [Gloeomargarita sp. SKYB120]MDW8177986.1 response regulator [Gloeomargarita sp. SKYBB_i_bin120]